MVPRSFTIESQQPLHLSCIDVLATPSQPQFLAQHSPAADQDSGRRGAKGWGRWGWFIELKLGNPSATGDTKTYSRAQSANNSDSKEAKRQEGAAGFSPWGPSSLMGMSGLYPTRGSGDVLESNLVKNCLMNAESTYKDIFFFKVLAQPTLPINEIQNSF